MLQAGRPRVRFPMSSSDFFDLSNPSSCIMALGSTQHVTEMSTRNVPGGGGVKGDRCVRMTTSSPSMNILSRRLTTLWASAACYRDSPNLHKSTITLYIDFKITTPAAATFRGQLCLHGYWFAFGLMDGDSRKLHQCL
jgi:hypothetical protein